MNNISGKDRLFEILSIIKRNGILSGITPQKLRKTCEELGPTFIKIGQILSNRPDLLSDEYIDELSKLRSNVKPMEYAEVLEIIDAETPKRLFEIFSSIETKPLGSASIAQVHKAILKTGEEVVIKVQRKDIKEKMTLDIKIMKKACKILRIESIINNIISISDILDELLATAIEEMNFVEEANNIVEFAKYNEEFAFMKVPKVYKELTSEKMLVMEYIDGIRINNKEELERRGYDLNEIAAKLADNYIYQALDTGFFHADPHPDNIYIMDGKIVYLDFGMMGHLSAQNKNILKKCLININDNDMFELEKNLLILVDARREVNHDKLRKDIERILDKNKNQDIANIDIADFSNDLMNMFVNNSLSVPHDITMLVRGIVVLEGTLETVNPNISLLEVIKNRLAGHTIKDVFNKDNIKKEIVETVSGLNKIHKIPGDLHIFLKEASNGNLKFNMSLPDANKYFDRLEKMVHRIVVCILDVAFILGAALIASNRVETKEQSFLFYLFVLLGIVFTIWLFVKMYLDKLSRRK